MIDVVDEGGRTSALISRVNGRAVLLRTPCKLKRVATNRGERWRKLWVCIMQPGKVTGVEVVNVVAAVGDAANAICAIRGDDRVLNRRRSARAVLNAARIGIDRVID